MGKKFRKVCQFDSSGNLIQMFDSPKEAEETLGLYRGSVSAVCNRNKDSTNGMIFRYEDDSNDIDDFIREKSDNIKDGKGRPRPVYQYDLDGNYIKEWSSVAEAKRNIKIGSSIAAVCSGQLRSSGGYVWSHEKKEKITVRPRKRKTGKTSLEDYCRDNGLSFLLGEWDYNKNELLPSEVSKGSNRVVAWVCKRGHHWETTIASRVAGRGCKECKRQMSTSFPEQAVYYYVKKCFPNAINRYIGRAIGEIDVFIPEINTGIEYDGKQWHKNTKRDQEKDNACLLAGIRLIRLREMGCPIYPSSSTIFLTKADTTSLTNTINDVILILSDISKRHIDIDVDVDRDFVEIISEIRKMEAENSLQKLFPKIANEWDIEKNNGVLPSAVSATSNFKYWWKCSNCGFSFPMPVANRTRLGEGCPRCGREKSRQAKIKTINQYDLNGNFIASYAGAKEAVKKTQLKHYNNINAVCERKQKTAGGYIWRYADDCDDVVQKSEET